MHLNKTAWPGYHRQTDDWVGAPKLSWLPIQPSGYFSGLTDSCMVAYCLHRQREVTRD